MADTRTSSDLARAVMEDLGLLEAEETPTAADASMIKRRYANILAELDYDRAVYWKVDEIPFEAFEALIALMRLVVGPSFGVPGLVGEDQNNTLEGAKRRLKKFVGKPASGEPTAVDYF